MGDNHVPKVISQKLVSHSHAVIEPDVISSFTYWELIHLNEEVEFLKV